MNTSVIDTIALKVADGSLKPLINLSSRSRKRVVLSATSDWQEGIEIELYYGFGKELFDRQLLDTLNIEHLPRELKCDLDIALNISVDDNRVVDLRLVVEGTNISLGRTYDMKAAQESINIAHYVDESASEEITLAPEEDAYPALPIDEDFVLGIDPYVSYDREEFLREEWEKKKQKLKRHARVSAVALYVVVFVGVVLLFSFLIYLGIRLPPLPPLRA